MLKLILHSQVTSAGFSKVQMVILPLKFIGIAKQLWLASSELADDHEEYHFPS